MIDNNKIPVIGFGTDLIPDGETVINAVTYAIESGYRLIDNADCYNNQKGVGIAIKNCIDRGIITRDDIFITSKVPDWKQGYNETIECCNNSLKEMGLDFFDLYLVHSPMRGYGDKWWVSVNETYRALIDLQGGGKGIIISSDQRVICPEVSGYYIPTLIKWGERELAKSYAEYLLTIQNDDGSWNEPYGKYKYTFDTGQILKGLWELINCEFVSEAQKQKYESAFKKGCDYIVAQQRENGSIATDNYDYWGLAYGKFVPESIHLYCLEPLRNAGKRFDTPKYEECIKKALNFYLADKALTDFTTLSHLMPT